MVEKVDGRNGKESSVPAADIVTTYRLHKGKITQLLADWDANTRRHAPHEQAKMASDAVTGAVAMAMFIKSQEHADAVGGLEMLQNPTSVRTTKDYAKGKLRLVGASPRVDRVTPDKAMPDKAIPLGVYTIGKHSLAMYTTPHFMPPKNPQGVANKMPWVAPFWVIPENEDDEEASVQLLFEVVDFGHMKVNVPVFVNPKALAKGVALTWSRAAAGKPAAQALGTSASASQAKAAMPASAVAPASGSQPKAATPTAKTVAAAAKRRKTGA